MKRKLTWLAGWFCAALALGFVFWLWPDGEKKGGVAAEGNSPRVTKPYPRERDAREQRTKNPREEFEAARKRGLTDEEVRKIVEDFLELGISWPDWGESIDELRVLKQKVNAYHLETLVVGFGLTQEQKWIAQEKLKEDYDQIVTEVSQAMRDAYKLGSDDLDWKSIKLEAGNVYMMVFWNFACVDSESLQPWNLCELDEVQKEMVGLRMEGEHFIWPRPGSTTVDFGTKEKYDDLDDPFTPFSNLSSFITEAGKIFPLSMEQVDRIRGANTIPSKQHNIVGPGRMGPLNYVKLLTAPQLMTLLLSKPEMAEELMKDLGE